MHPYFQTILEKYLEDTLDRPHVLVLGSGKAYNCGYPQNYFCLDDDPTVEPDLIADITQTGAIPAILRERFGFVVWEHLPRDLLLASG